MKIAYITEPLSFLSGKGNGISGQAVTWAKSLREKGHTVELIIPWGDYSWEEFEIIHLFGSSDMWFYSLAKSLYQINQNIFWSPICDNIDSPLLQHIKTYIGFDSLKLFSLPYIRKKAYPLFKVIFARSEYEKNYLVNAYGVDSKKVVVVPIAMSYNDQPILDKKESFCLHISNLTQTRKNVLRLIESARKFHFRLVLAGSKGSPIEYARIEKAIGWDSNIEVLGFISEEKKKELYQKAKVFALPSIKEGVGIVALDAAHYGCDIVITSIGGPKEYYNGMAYIVDPYSVDSIGTSIIQAMNSTMQPRLKQWVEKKYNRESIVERLLSVYHSNTRKE